VEPSAYISLVEFLVEAAQLINEGGVHCVPVVFARPLQGRAPVELGARAYLNDMPVQRLDTALAAERGGGVVAFVLEDAMDARWFKPGEVVRLEQR
jgi:D-serine deaminase-like pyridoxal phosphate-dependent protein